MLARLHALLAFAIALAAPGATAHGAGTLQPRGVADQPIRIVDHHVDVVLNNGFARTEVTQTFFNPNTRDLAATYSFPLPKSASLAEVTIFAGEKELNGEVVPREEARAAYEEERDRGNDAGLAEKNEFKTFEFSVTPVRANAETRIRFVYYQPLEIDTGVGRYLYPLRDGGTDEAAEAFWARNEQVEQTFSVDLTLKSACPVDQVRIPDFADAQVDRLGDGWYRVHAERRQFVLDHDFVVYYRLQDGLPGRVELIAHKPAADRPGTFMMVVTPGIDLQPITEGADYTFVLDVSGSMASKLHALVEGMVRTLGSLKAGDRYRIVVFNDRARPLTDGYIPVTPESVLAGAQLVQSLQSGGGTNLFGALGEALDEFEPGRATSLVLVTDGVANVGPIGGAAFRDLMQQYDVRVFAFVMGNSANWPLMRVICDASGGFAAGVSVDDDIVGQLLLARSKIATECLHDAELKIEGVRTFDASDELLGKVWRGQQLVIFGRYERGGTATVSLQARTTREERTYATTFDFPDVETAHPEIERLWAMDAIERLERQTDAGLLDASESDVAIQDLGVQYQLVTDRTAMIVLADEDFARHGIDRKNQERVAREREAQQVRIDEPPQDHRADRNQPMFQDQAPTTGNGAFGPIELGLALLLLLVAWRSRKP